MTDDLPRHRAGRLGRVAMGERLGGFIYGTIVVLAVIVAGAKAYPHAAGHIAVLVVITTAALWLAHVYAHGLGESLARGQRLSLAELSHVARHEASIIEAGGPSVAALLLGAFGVLSTRTAVWVALGLGLGILAAEGIIFARAERLGALGTLLLVMVNLGFGVLLIGLKLFLTH